MSEHALHGDAALPGLIERPEYETVHHGIEGRLLIGVHDARAATR